MAPAAADDVLPELLAIFAEEAEDRLLAMDRDILALEQTADPQDHARLLTEIFRNAHTLKGAAAIVQLEDVTAIAHGLESVFDLLKEGMLRYGSNMFDVLYGACDALAAAVRAGLARTPSEVDVAAVTASLRALAAAAQDGDQRSGSEPPPRPEVRSAAGERAADGPAPKGRSVERPAADTVRVASSKLDALMAQVGELLVARIGAERRIARLREMAAALGGAPAGQAPVEDLGRQLVELRRELEADGRRMGHLTATLQEDVRRARMLPVANLFDAVPRVVRDLARDQGKDVVVVADGGDTEVDRSVLEQLRGPLTHLVRNAVDHGMELPGEREAAGKPARGTIALRASQQGSTVVIEIQDDGRGIDPAAVRKTAVARGAVSRSEAAAMEDDEAIWLVFRPGFSTRATVTEVSGRGVGMDVVRENVERMQGTVAVDNAPGRGVRFSLALPLTVATTRCLLVGCRDATFAIPTVNVSHIMRVDPASIGQVGGRMVLRLDQGPVPLVDLWEALGHAGGDGAVNGRSGGNAHGNGSNGSHPPVIVLRGGDRHVGLAVDDLRGAEEVVIKPLPPPLVRIPGIAGVTILGGGEVVLIVAAADLLRSARGAAVRAEPALGSSNGHWPDRAFSNGDAGGAAIGNGNGNGNGDGRPPGPTTILVADDSFMTRTLAKNVLESAGYRVLTAVDGMEAWTLLSSERCDLILSDVEMPRMDGLDLTARVRAEARLRDLPVILLTSLDSKEQAERGLEAGADAYMTKGSFEQANLLEAIRRLT